MVHPCQPAERPGACMADFPSDASVCTHGSPERARHPLLVGSANDWWQRSRSAARKGNRPAEFDTKRTAENDDISGFSMTSVRLAAPLALSGGPLSRPGGPRSIYAPHLRTGTHGDRGFPVELPLFGASSGELYFQFFVSRAVRWWKNFLLGELCTICNFKIR